MENRALPEGAYEALEGLKEQATIATELLPSSGKSEIADAKHRMGVAQAKMAANEDWTKLIVQALMRGDGMVTAATADEHWLERTFADTTEAHGERGKDA